MAQDHSEREALCAPHRVIYVNAGGSQPTFRRDRTSRTLVVLAVLGLAMCAALVMLGSNEDAVMAAGKDHGVVLSTAREQSLSAAKADLDALSDDVDDDDEDEDEDKDDDDTDADKKDDGKDDGKEETAAKSQVTPSLASGDAGQEEEGPPKDDADSEPDTADPDEGKDDGAPAAPAEKEKSADDLIAEQQAAEKVPPPPGCSSTAKDCLKTCLTQNAVEGDKVESLMGMSKDYAECFINECEDKELPEGKKCTLTATEFDRCWKSLEDLSAELMETMEKCTVQVSGDAKLRIDAFLNTYATDFD